MPRTPRSSRRAAGSAATSLRTSTTTTTTPEPHMAALQEEGEHCRLAASQHDELVQEKLDHLRGLVKDIKADDWKYDPKERLPAHVTKSLAWKQQPTTTAQAHHH